MLNRTMHISGALKKQDIKSEKQDIEQIVRAGVPKKSEPNAVLLFEAFGFDRFFGRTEVMGLLSLTPSPESELLRKLSAADILRARQRNGQREIPFQSSILQIMTAGVILCFSGADSDRRRKKNALTLQRKQR